MKYRTGRRPIGNRHFKIDESREYLSPRYYKRLVPIEERMSGVKKSETLTAKEPPETLKKSTKSHDPPATIEKPPNTRSYTVAAKRSADEKKSPARKRKKSKLTTPKDVFDQRGFGGRRVRITALSPVESAVQRARALVALRRKCKKKVCKQIGRKSIRVRKKIRKRGRKPKKTKRWRRRKN